MTLRVFRVHVAVSLVAAMVLAVTVGCGRGGPKVQPVSGTVTINGAPAQNVQVVFSPVDAAGQLASGQVNASGVYTLSTGNMGAPGAVEGKYKIVLRQLEDTSPEAMKARYSSAGGKPPAEPKLSFPKEYLSADKSPKEVDVKPGANTIDLAL